MPPALDGLMSSLFPFLPGTGESHHVGEHVLVQHLLLEGPLSTRNALVSTVRGLNPDLGSPFSRSLRGNAAIYCCPSLNRTEEGWILWELGEQHDPLACCWG